MHNMLGNELLTKYTGKLCVSAYVSFNEILYTSWMSLLQVVEYLVIVTDYTVPFDLFHFINIFNYLKGM